MTPPRIRFLERTPCYTFVHRVAARGGVRRLEAVPVLAGGIENLPAGFEALVCASDLQGVATDDINLLSGIRCAQEIALWIEYAGLSPKRTLVLLAGDFYAAPGAHSRGVSGEVDAVWHEWCSRFGAVVGIAGNHDRFSPEFAHQLDSKCHLLDGECIELGGLRIAGWGGVIASGAPILTPPLAPKNQSWPRLAWSEADFITSWRNVMRSKPHLVLVHETPAWPQKNEPGSMFVQAMLEENRNLSLLPPLVIGGHVHWNQAWREMENGMQILACDGRVFVLTQVKH